MSSGATLETKIQFHSESEPLPGSLFNRVGHSSMSMAGKPGFNGLSTRDWTLLSASVFSSREVSSARNEFHKEHGATFPLALAERAISLYAGEDDTVLDPFLGTGTTIIAACKLNRKGIGFELYDRFAFIAINLLEEEKTQRNMRASIGQDRVLNTDDLKIVEGDCLELIKELEGNSIQLTFTSPPYADFIHKSVKDREKRAKSTMPSAIVTENKSSVSAYGESDRDFGNLDYESFLISVEELMAEIYRVTKPGGYNVWVVKDYRDTKNLKPYIDVHTGIANAGANVGFFYHDLIIWDQNAQRTLVLNGYPSVFYTNQNHSYLVVLRKPTIKQAKQLEKIFTKNQSEIYGSMKVADLRKILRNRKLAVSGKKSDLISRLVDQDCLEWWRNYDAPQ